MALQKKPVPGMMSVNSDVIKPEELSRHDFDSWYCDEHIPDVVAKSGIRAAYRYNFVADGSSPARKLGFLTLYEMDDIGFMETEEFRTLEGQRPGPSRDRIFKKAEFDTRGYELIQYDDATRADQAPAKFLLYAAMSHTSDADLDAWYRGEHVAEISKCPGYRRTRRYKLSSRSILSEFVRSVPALGPTWLAIHEFEGPNMPWKELQATDETDWAKKVVPGIRDIDFGVFELKRVYGKLGHSKL
ncbi:hypothetical protein BP5796_13078 [Coleophoma crateriformis]|uniref:EthD domain-containing protein n=1 Tax=Coleophoma crateriformis TaxID=565419 RepID=A0A3D8Q442_9HELO|nr:hypothetical protein BP5796_13078 [Coleophoma crateriformis]